MLAQLADLLAGRFASPVMPGVFALPRAWTISAAGRRNRGPRLRSTHVPARDDAVPNHLGRLTQKCGNTHSHNSRERSGANTRDAAVDTQHLVNVNCCDSISIMLLLDRAESMPKAIQAGSRGYRRSSGRRATPNYSRRAAHAQGQEQTNDPDFFTAKTTSPLPPLPSCPFFMNFRGPKAHPNRPQRTMVCHHHTSYSTR